MSLLSYSNLDASTTKASFQSGDVLLISLNCYSCALIERASGAPYSHSGIILKIGRQWRVAQALGEVHDVSLSEFMALRKQGTRIAHLRAIDLVTSEQELVANYKSFIGIPFDRNYLWDDEALYCSEFVAKFFQRFDSSLLAPSPIDYGADDEIWRRHLGNRYNGGELGNSPASLLNDPFFKFLDYL